MSPGFHHLDPPQHLPDDDLDVLVVDLDPLEAVDLLDFVHQIPGQFLEAADVQDIVGVGGAVHEGFSGPDIVALLHGHVLALGDQVLLGFAYLRGDKILRLPLMWRPKETTPLISLIMAVSLGLRTSKSSATRGRPPVMSLVLVVSRGILAIMSPGKISSPSLTMRMAPTGMK